VRDFHLVLKKGLKQALKKSFHGFFSAGLCEVNPCWASESLPQLTIPPGTVTFLSFFSAGFPGVNPRQACKSLPRFAATSLCGIFIWC
jgi:hypothetical protein